MILIKKNNLMKKFYLKLLRYYERESNKSEDRIVLKFLTKENDRNQQKKYIEIGSGLGRFVKIVHHLFNYNIQAVEINKDLAEQTNNLKIHTLNINFLENHFDSNHFDIVHCSHVIEHIPYPDVIAFLDELIRITKPNGYIIIRSPLMSIEFYTSIDHIRPYPPKAILDYYSNPQQQRVGKYTVLPVKIKLRRSPLLVSGYSYNPMIRAINMFFKLSWCLFRFPFSKPDGYVIILRKQV